MGGVCVFCFSLFICLYLGLVVGEKQNKTKHTHMAHKMPSLNNQVRYIDAIKITMSSRCNKGSKAPPIFTLNSSAIKINGCAACLHQSFLEFLWGVHVPCLGLLLLLLAQGCDLSHHLLSNRRDSSGMYSGFLDLL